MNEMNMPEPRWAGRTDFAEVAEAIGVRTDQIMSVYAPGAGRPLLVLYTPGDDEVIWRCTVARDADGILIADVAVECPGMWDRIKRAVDEGLGELDDLAMGGE